LKTSKWIYDKYGNCRSPESLKCIDLKDSGYSLGDNKEEILNYKKICRLLDISIEDDLSKQEKEVYKMISYFSMEELDRLREYITNKLRDKLEV